MNTIARWMIAAVLATTALSASADERWVVLGGDVAEVLALIAPRTPLVGRDDTVLFPPALATLPSVGYLRRLSAQSVLSLRPSHVMASEHAGPAEVLEQLEEVGVEVVSIDAADSLASITAKVRAIARHTGHEAAGEALAAELAASLESLAGTPRLDDVRAMFILQHSGLSPRAAGAGTAAHTALEAVGVDNAFAAMQGYHGVNAEALVREAPDIVVMSARGLEALGGETALWRLPGLALTPAGRDERLVVIDDQALLGFGPRAPQALLVLRHDIESALATAPRQIP